MTARLRWHYSPMNGGKSTLALQLDYNHRQCGRQGIRFTCLDRAGQAIITSRLGISADAHEVTPTTDLAAVVRDAVTAGENITYVIADEAQFYTPAQVEQLADIVDDLRIAVYAFGIATDFTSAMFQGSKRLFEIADEHIPLQVQALCWCGEVARMNARIVNGEVATEGQQVMVGDVAGAAVTYATLCRPHYRAGQHQALHLSAVRTA